MKRTKQMLPSHQVRAELGKADEANRTVEVTWSTGAKGIRSGWEGNYYEELSMTPEAVDMERLNSGAAPVLSNHDRNSNDGVIGVVDKAWIENGQGKALLRFSASDPVADKTFKKIQERVLRNVSVGYSVQEYRDTSKKGDKVPTYLATRWQPQEISIVPIGFDMKATTRNQDLQMSEVEIVSAHSEQPIQENTMSQENKPTEVSTPAVDAAAERKAATAQERTRVSEIKTAVTSADLDASLALDMIERGLTTAEASKEVIAKMAEKQKQTAIKSAAVTVTRDEKEVTREGVANYLSYQFNRSNKLDDNGKRFMGRSLVHIAEQVAGRQTFESDSQLALRALTTSDLPNILANVAEKEMRQAYSIQNPSYKAWTKAGTLRNYKTANRLMLGDFPSLTAVDEHGEFTAGAVSESKETIKLVRYGKRIAFTKEMIVNDDLGALVGFPAKGAVASTRLESSLVYSLLTANPTMGDSIALFHASHGNLAGSGTAITIAAMGAAFQAMRNQTTLDAGDYVDIQPKYLIVGSAKEAEARQFLSTNMLAQQISNVNIYAGRLELVVDPRVSGNNWFLAADSALIDTVEVAHLEGEEGPSMTIIQDPRKPGSIELQMEHNVGVSVLDFRGLYKNPGA